MEDFNTKCELKEIEERKKFINTLTKSIKTSTNIIFIRTAILDNLKQIELLYENIENRQN